MAVSKSVIEFALTADASGLIGPVQKARGEFASLEQSAGKAAKSTETGFAAMGDRLQGLGNKLLGVGAAMTVATLPLAAALKSGASALMDAEKRAAQTNAVLQSTGQVAGVTAEHVGALAGELRDMSGVSGGAIREGENLLLTFTNIRNAAGQGKDVFDRTTKAALDMSVAMGTDMKTASQTLGKALNDPIGGLGRLQRVGVQFSEGQKQQIQNFVRMGDVASAQGVILDEVGKKFGGSAKAFGETTAGQMAKAEAAFAQVKMALASGLAPALSGIASLLGSVANAFNGLDGGTKTVISSVALFAVALGPLTTLAGGVVKGMKGIGAAIDALKVKFSGLQESGGILNALKNNIGGIAIGAAGIAAAVGFEMLASQINRAGEQAASAEQNVAKSNAGQISSYGDLQKALDATGQRLDELHRQKDAIQKGEDAPLIDPLLLNWGKRSEANRQALKVEEDAWNEYSGRLEYVNSVLGTLQQKTGMSREELTRLAQVLNLDITQQDQAATFQRTAEAIDQVAKASGLTRDQVVELSRTFGIDLTQDTDAAAAQMERLAQGFGTAAAALPYTTEELNGFAQKLGIDLKEGGDDAARTLQTFAKWAHQAGYDSQIASGQIDKLQSAVNATIMPWLNQQQAVTSYQQALDQLPAQIKRIADANYEGLSAEEAVNARRHDGEALMGQMAQQTVSAYLAQYQLLGANAQTAEGQAVLNGLLGQGQDSLGKIAERFGITREDAKKYKDQLDHIPSLVKTTVDADTKPALDKIAELRRAVTGFYSTFKLPVPKLPPPGARGGTIVDGVAHFARGGMFDQATAIVGEGKGREWVIPEDPAYRGRALGLWRQAGAALMAAGGTVGGDGAAATTLGGTPADGSLAVLLQIRDVLVQIASAAAIAPSVGGVGGTPDVGGAPAVGGGMAAAADSTGVAAAATSGLSDTVAAAAPVVAGFDGQLVQAASATLPAVTVATQQSDLATQAATATLLAQLPVQAAWQTMMAASKAAIDLLTAATDILIGRLGVLNATQVVLHVDSSQVQSASTSIAHLAETVQSSLSKLGLGTNQLSQWLGVVLALPAGVITSAVGAAESGGVVGNVGAGMKGHSPTLVMEGSRAYDEYVIPTDPKYRRNAMGLLAGLHSDLGVQQMAAGGVVGNESRTPWGGTAAAVPGTLGSVLSGSMIAAAALASSVLSSGGKGVPPYPPGGDAVGSAISWILANWDVVDGGRYGERSYYSDHTSGNAFDAMTGDMATGNSLRDWFLANPNWYGTKYTIWQQDIRYPNGSGHRMEDRGGATANHMDHVHISFVHDNAGARGQMGGGTAAGGAPGGAGGPVDVPQPWKGVGQYIVDHFARATGGGGASGGGGPIGADVPAGARTWHGKISEFGGPGDYQGTAYDGNTRDLYAQRFPFAAMRDRDMANQWVGISAGGGAVKAQILDYGPATWTGRIIDVSPTVLSDLGVDTDATVDIWQLAEGGKIRSYDRGGWLPEGISLAHNGTGAPEPVGFGGGRPVVVNVTVEGSVTSESDLVDRISEAIRSNMRRGAVGVG